MSLPEHMLMLISEVGNDPVKIRAALASDVGAGERLQLARAPCRVCQIKTWSFEKLVKR